MIKTKEKEQKSSTESGKKYVGLGVMVIKAVNPTRSELNKLMGKEDSETDKEIEYLTQDKEGNDRIRLSFWMYSKDLDKYFVHSFNVTNKKRTSVDGTKAQMINSTCTTAWAPFVLDSAGEPTEKIQTDLLPDWFSNFQDKDKHNIAPKPYRQALAGEDELAILMRSWLGRWNWKDEEADARLDMSKLFAEDYSEFASLVGTSYTTSFVPLTGVKTDEGDATKQYQQIYGKGFLPEAIMDYVKNGFKWKNDKAGKWNKKMWDKFESDVKGEYGFTSSYFKLVPLEEYDAAEDVATSKKAKVDVSPTNAKF